MKTTHDLTHSENFCLVINFLRTLHSSSYRFCYGTDILISPAVGAVFMSLSTVIVANAQLLKRKMTAGKGE